MSEKSDRRLVVQVLHGLHAIAVENPVHPGTPDVNYVEGWLELKWLPNWPRRGGVVRLPKLRRDQVLFLERRWAAGGRAHLLLHVQETREWLLYEGGAVGMLGQVGVEELRQLACRRWVGTQFKEELEACLSVRRT